MHKKERSVQQENSKRLCHLSSRIIADNIRSTLISIELCFSSLLGNVKSENLVNRTEVCACKRVSGVHEYVVRILSNSLTSLRTMSC